MNHLVYTLDVALPQEWTPERIKQVGDAIDRALEECPLEVEDWKEYYYMEERNV